MSDSDTELLIDHDVNGNGALGEAPSTQRTLNTFFGVIVPCCLSMFSVVLFLRMGFIIGQAGLIQALIMLVIAFIIIALTVTSVCAISTNGAVEAGGAYFMISRALGPEMGASIGLMFYLANAAAVAMYIFGMCETIIDDFGPGGQLLPSINSTGIPTSQWIEYGYGTALLFLVAVICLVGADIYAKAVFGIFIVVGSAIICVIVSFFVEKEMQVPVVNPDWPNRTELYTGFSSQTFHANLYSNYTIDYKHHDKGLYSFSEIFALLFCYKHTCLTAITHILERTAQGELKNPSKSIPVGTIAACSIVCFTYILLMMFIAATCPKALLNNNYTFLQAINFWPPIVFIGIFFSSFSAALSSLIGASRVLHAMAKDGMFGPALRLVKMTNSKGNPYVAVVMTWFLIQVVLLIGKLNAIAPLVTIFFLLAYTACDLACLGLDWASAPNFRPTFKYFSWHTALLGVISTMAVMFLVNYIWALAAMAIMIILSAISHYTAPQVAWGSISQALIFHQVRKYALKMNVQDSSIDSWRPGILYLVRDITASVEGLLFVNDLKKSGLLVLGHVNLGSIDEEDMESSKRKLNAWYDFVKRIKSRRLSSIQLAQTYDWVPNSFCDYPAWAG
ncbi:Oidioi.mRNA.OKI2018_I69.chr1.g2393.t1.cds [Oikopleura dioica]|uniref:Oidioi.mRNA.OKI2018_I69.chr1.g2393.t1.cds n=1 Tax=Oikopleura dioica TaxID=34765 RepID=A0ABN7SRK0_OIKDI|nr:Oidioi.mRNA.OKI2018_I69.chr1.g2393.t1.cds [Oikopleura dioica]